MAQILWLGLLNLRLVYNYILTKTNGNYRFIAMLMELSCLKIQLIKCSFIIMVLVSGDLVVRRLTVLTGNNGWQIDCE